MSNLYSHREEQNNQRFDQLAQTLQQFRTTVDNDIHGAVQLDMLTLDLLNDNFGQLWTKVRRTSGELRNVMNRNASLSRIVFIILLIFFLLWTVAKLRA
ncbi:CIC11C00000000251 [Sungouiella intermedia]|uniref:CIC11C00000000251 n=1 Tax=Sungouiella intermedia TaxID=45354 RepID=A0A1L0BDS5_9ASCO|nr:CIC11C00000000251 [[Candida] intermedia]